MSDNDVLVNISREMRDRAIERAEKAIEDGAWVCAVIALMDCYRYDGIVKFVGKGAQD